LIGPLDRLICPLSAALQILGARRAASGYDRPTPAGSAAGNPERRIA
jgi:hypothetical protein